MLYLYFIWFTGGFDLRKYSNRDLGIVHIITYETLLNDEVNQVVGFTHFGDLYSITPAYITLFTPNEFATLIKWGEVNITDKQFCNLLFVYFANGYSLTHILIHSVYYFNYSLLLFPFFLCIQRPSRVTLSVKIKDSLIMHT